MSIACCIVATAIGLAQRSGAQKAGVPPATDLPADVRTEFDRMAGFFETVEAGYKSHEEQWRGRFATSTPAAVSEALGEVAAARRMVADVENGPALDIGAFSARAPSRIWRPAGRISPDRFSERLPPVGGAELRIGPDGVVVAHSGELCLDAVDMVLPSRGGIGFEFTRHYRSHSDYDGPMGYGWDHNHNLRIKADAPSLAEAKVLHLHGGDFETEFRRDGDKWLCERGAFVHLDAGGRGLLQLTDSNRTLWTFEPAVTAAQGKACWRIQSKRSRHGEAAGNHLVYRYVDGKDTLARVEDPFGEVVRLYHDENGRLRALSAPGRYVEFKHNADGCLTSVSFPPVASSLSKTMACTTEYSYIPGGGRQWCVSQRSNQSGHVLFAEVDLQAGSATFGKVTSAGYRLVARPGEKIEWAFGRNVGADDFTVTMTPPSPGTRVSFDFPKGARFPWLAARMSMPAREASWRYDYNEDGLRVQSDDPDGFRVSRRFDSGNVDARARGNCFEDTVSALAVNPKGGLKAKGQVFEFLPGTGFPTRVVAYQIDDSEKRTDLLEKRYEYKAGSLDLLKSSTSGETTWHFWNQRGEALADVDGAGSITLYSYMPALPTNEMTAFADGSAQGGGLLARIVEDAPIANLANAISPDDRNRLAGLPKRLAETPVKPETTRILYDRFGRKTGQEGPGTRAFSVLNRLGQPLVSWDTASGLAMVEYDQQLRRRRVYHQFQSAGEQGKPYPGHAIKPFGGRFYLESYEYDDWSRVASFSPSDEPAEGQKQGPVFHYERYPSGTLHKLIEPSGIARVHEYDPGTGLPRQISLAGKSGEKIVLQKFLRHSPSGELLSYDDDHGETWTNRLDSLGRGFESDHPDGSTSRIELDGLDRPVRQTAWSNERLIDEKIWEYTPSGRTEKITQKRIREKDGEIAPVGLMVVEENKYDVGGRLTARKGARTDAWQQFYYDGLGRAVAQKTPEGDWALVFYRQGSIAVSSALMRRPDAGDIVGLREVTILNDRFKPLALVPVDSDGKPRWARMRMQRWSPEGRMLETLEAEGLHTEVSYNTRGERVEDSTEPTLQGKGQRRHSVWKYDISGRQIAQTTDVNPLALYREDGPDKPVVPRRLPVPQIIQWHYDGLGRLARAVQPDGLEVSREYDQSGCMVGRMTWRHISKPDVAVRDIEFHYGARRRLKEVAQAADKKILQTFDYDVWGQIKGSADMTGHERVSVRREQDNMGIMWREQINYGHVKMQDLEMETNPEQGTNRLHWHQPNALPLSFWTDASYKSDLNGRVSSLSLNGKELCRWRYQGQTPISRSIPSSLTEQAISLDAMGEVIGLTVNADSLHKKAPLSIMRYALDSGGGQIGASVSLRGNAGQPYSVVCQYNDLDAFRQISASAQESFDFPDLAARQRTLFAPGGSAASVLATRTHRDEAGNVMATYQGQAADSVLKTALERGELFSSSRMIRMAATEAGGTDEPTLVRKLSEAERLQLASNRQTTAVAQGREGSSSDYDTLGQVAEFDGEYDEGRRKQDVVWHLDFDSLGRLVKMLATERIRDKDNAAGPGAKVAELEFVYDTWNRRIVKRVFDHKTSKVRREAALYCGDRQTVILEQDEDTSWRPMQEYVWGASPVEVLQVITSPKFSGVGQSAVFENYTLHQDRSMDVVFATSVAGDSIRSTPLCSYLDSGATNSTTRISGVSSSATVENPAACTNGRVDDGTPTKWTPKKDGWDWIELKLPDARRLTKLTIWTNSFPNDFDIYSLPQGMSPPIDGDIEAWRKMAEADGRHISHVKGGSFPGRYGTRHKYSLLECPYELFLRRTSTTRLIIVWRNSGENRVVSVNEFSVQAEPEMVASLGQNGRCIDRETGLYYQLHRYSSPALNGKFISPDPLGFLGGPDLYAYANNNPLQWHDPDGQFAQILGGAAVGASIGAGSYLFQCWWTGEEFSWGRLAIRTGTGALTGAVAAATFGLGGLAISGGAAGFTGGMVGTTAEAWLLDRKSFGDSMRMGLAAGGRGLVIGAIGGGIGGGAFSRFGPGFWGAVGSGGVGGAAAGAVDGAWTGFQEHGLGMEMLRSAGRGALQGAAYGAAIGGAGWGVGRATEFGRGPKIAYETELKTTSYPGKSRGAHFQEANDSLLSAMESVPSVAAKMKQYGVNLSRSETGLAPRQSPDGWTWHHGQEPGSMQLVYRPHHAPGSKFQEMLHPNGVGGYSIWGK